MKQEEVFGSWDDAVANTTAAINSIMPEEKLESMLSETRKTVALQPGKTVVYGSGWGALEEMRLGKKLAAQLDFGTVSEEQSIWVELLQNNQIGSEEITSYLVSDEWFELLKKADENWQKHYFMALNYYRRQDLERAEKEVTLCGDISENRYLLHLLANIRRLQKQNSEAAELITKAASLNLNDVSFIKEVLKMLLNLEAYENMSGIITQLPAEVAELPLIKMMKSFALAYTGNLDEAEHILLNEISEIPDIREGENSTSQLYIYIQQQKARKLGKEVAPGDVEVPWHLDLRMSASI
jgi:tetratricopeptide (TPR) repeat protein